MIFSYFGGSIGVLISGLVRCNAGLVELFTSNQTSILTFFVGANFIHPLGVLLSKILKCPGNHNPENPLANLALESLTLLIIGCFLAFYVVKLLMPVTIGLYYLFFNTLFSAKIYWLFGASLIFSGVLCILFDANFIIGGVTEVIFSIVILNQSKGLTLKTT